VRGELVDVQAVAALIDPEILPGDKALPPQLVGDSARGAD
jgi:hypothetical protein